MKSINTVFPCIISAETSFTLGLKIWEFFIVSKFISSKAWEKGWNYLKEETNERRVTTQGNKIHILWSAE